MTESNKSERRGLGQRRNPPFQPKEPEKQPDISGSIPKLPISQKKKKSAVPAIILFVTGLAVFGGIGWLLWSNDQKNSQQRIEIDQKYSKIKEAIPQIDKDITNAKSLGDLKTLDVMLSKSGKDLDELKNQAEQIGYSNGLDNIKADIEIYKTSSSKLNSRIASENNANAIIKDAKDSVKSFLNVESLDCDSLKGAEPKFGEAIAKLKTVPAQTFAQVEVKKLSSDYTSLKTRAIDQYKAICTAPPVPPSPVDNPVKPDISYNGGSSDNPSGSSNNSTSQVPPNTSNPPSDKIDPKLPKTNPSEVCRLNGSTIICP
jgi:predicted negative regulator of RcsB-dependent stress response